MIGRAPRAPIQKRAIWGAAAAMACLMPFSMSAAAQDKQIDSAAAQLTAPRSPGERVYVDQGCAVCHGLIGHGGVGPAFQGDKFLALGNYAAAQILLGRGQMPGFADRLSDDEIAAVASYIRDSWGNHFGQLSSNDVKEMRSKTHSE